MSRDLLRRTLLVIPLGLATLAGCNDTVTTAPKFAPGAPLAQGAGGVWTVNSLADPGDGICDDTHCTLREAISAAAFGDQVVFASGLQGTIALSSRLDILKQVSVDGGGRITLDAQGNHGVIATTSVLGQVAVSITLDGLTLKNGSSPSEGGGIRLGDYTWVTVRNSTISGNVAVTDGGGIFVPPTGALWLFNSTVANNTASSGGGIKSDGDLTVVRSTISGNAGGTGSIHNYGRAQVISSTVVGNSRGINNGGSFNFTIENSIIAGNGQLNCDGGFVISLGYNLTTPGTGCTFFAVGDVSVNVAQLFTSVLEQSPQDNGGMTMTHALIARGLAVDAGYCPGETADQRGFARPVDDPTLPNAKDGCDIGAYEAQGPQVAVADLMVSQTVDKNSVKQGELLTYTVRVRNLGPQTAPNVVLNNVLSSGVTFFAARQNTGTITAPPRGETGTVTWNIGDMADQANEFAEIQVTVLVKGKTTITNTATVSANVADPNPANNSAAITVTVAPGKSGKG